MRGWCWIQNAITIESGGRLDIVGALTLNSSLMLTSGGQLQVSGAFTSSVPVTVAGGTLAADNFAVSTATLTNGGVLTCPPSTATEMHKLQIQVSGTLTVDATSRIDVSRKGYLPGYTKGNTTNGGATGLSGGSYGGLGNSSGGSPCVVYGDYAAVDEMGSGSGPANQFTASASGGGLVQITAGTLQLDGKLLADGGGPTGGSNSGCGGGINVVVATLQGAGLIRAGGGNGGLSSGGGNGAAGGGGRVAVYAAALSGFDTAKITTPGGTGPNGGIYAAAAGTVFILQGVPHTHVRSFQPAGINGGLVGNELPTITNRTGHTNNGFDRFTLTFNKPINTDSSAIANFAITGPFGRIPVSGLVEVSDRTYEVSFPLQTTNGIYHFTLLPKLLDSEGFQLDQDADGIPGESSDDVYTFTLILDTVGPRIVQHSPS